MNKKKFDKLTAEQQNIILDSAKKAGVFQRKLNEENQAKQIAEFQKAGVEVIMEVDQKPFKDVTFDAVSKFYTDQCGDKLIKDINAELAK